MGYDVEFVTMGVGTNSMLIRTGSYGNGVAAKNGDYEKCGVDLFGAGLKDDCSCPPPSHDAVLTEFNIRINQMIVDDCVAGSTSGVMIGESPAPVAWATDFSQTCEIRCINPVPGVDIAAVERTTSFTKAGVVPPCNKVAFTLSPAPTISPASTAADPTSPPTSLPTRRPTNRPTNRPTRRPVEEDEPTEAPVDPTEAPVDPTEAPVDPPDPTEAPVDPTEAPVDPTDPESSDDPGSFGYGCYKTPSCSCGPDECNPDLCEAKGKMWISPASVVGSGYESGCGESTRCQEDEFC